MADIFFFRFLGIKIELTTCFMSHIMTSEENVELIDILVVGSLLCYI